MPSGPKKRKAAKKKQVKESNNSNSSSTTHSLHGESDGGELNSPAAQQNQHSNQLPFTEQQVEKREDESSNKKAGINIEIDKVGSKSKSSSSGSQTSDDETRVFEKNVVVLESAPIEPIPEKVENLAVETSVVLDSVKPADFSFKEVNDDNEKIEEKACLIVEEKTVAVNGSCSKDKSSTSYIENVAEKLTSTEENVAASTFNDNDDDDEDRVNEPDALQYSDKQALVTSAPQAVQKTSWKGCCGILELLSSSDR